MCLLRDNNQVLVSSDGIDTMELAKQSVQSFPCITIA